MQFYKMLSKYYDEIFPLNNKTLEMVKSITRDNGDVLDVGCATGQLIRSLEKDSYRVTGLEYEPMLIGYPERTVTGDMHELPFDDSSYDTLVCTGNTLAHGRDMDDISGILGEFARVLRSGGKAVIQVLNYHRILDKRPEQLPAIETEHVTFERHYEYQGGDNIKFIGKLICANDIEESSVQLYPVTAEELVGCAKGLGFTVDDMYGGFDKSKFAVDNNFPFIVILNKKN